MTIELETEISDAQRRRMLIYERIAGEVRHGHTLGQARIATVASLLNGFRRRGSHAALQCVIDDLRRHGVAVDSGWTTGAGTPDIRRTGTLTLSIVGNPSADDPTAEGDPSIQLSVWSQDGRTRDVRPLGECQRQSPTDILWFNIDPPVPPPALEGTASTENASTRINGDRHMAVENRARYIATRLRSSCPGLTEEMVRDLLLQDVQPKLETYGDERDGIRGVSVVAVVARETPGRSDQVDGVNEELVFQMVEIVVGKGWLVTCWHPSRVFAGTHEEQPGDSLLREPFLAEVVNQWLSNSSAGDGGRPSQTSGDLGLYLSRSLVGTFGPSHRMMERWVASWEVDFYRCLTREDKAERLKEAAREISNLLAMVGEFRRRLTAFQHARWSTSDGSWFPDLSDHDDTLLTEADQSRREKALAASVDSAGERFSLLASSVRANMDLLMLQSAATQQESTERLQGYLGKVTGLVLVPTLVAGFFGANTRLPGGGSWLGLELMLVLMVLSAVAVYHFIRKLA